MTVANILLIVLILGALGYVAGRLRARAVSGDDARLLHSLPGYYGWNAAMFTVIPALAIMLVWLLVQPVVIERNISAMITSDMIPEGSSQSLVMSDLRRVSEGLSTAVETGVMTAQEAEQFGQGSTDIRGALAAVGVALGNDVSPELLQAAQDYRNSSARGIIVMGLIAIVLALCGLAYSIRSTTVDFRARNTVEAGVKALLIFASVIAIATTAGIIFSMLFETSNFFRQYSWTEFFFGTEWAPNFRGNSSLGMLPLLWGTLYISLIALIVAVPIGLFAAIYMSEYAGPKFRAVAKPLIEVLAGIPTIVYGLFALITVGPMLRDYFAQPLGLGESGSSVMTAGLVMGIMIIPFVSSLSDDIINAVPQSLRDGSLGLGSTQSETIRQVVLPAALPGIVGAVLLAASRAIGETMIVVLGAGAAARMGLNPFEAMTTITVKIVSQLTGDTDFAAPETLVAFALGLTLFVITLGLNVLALVIVRKYREQYE
jgi:phosphate transport system permease protein